MINIKYTSKDLFIKEIKFIDDRYNKYLDPIEYIIYNTSDNREIKIYSEIVPNTNKYNTENMISVFIEENNESKNKITSSMIYMNTQSAEYLVLSYLNDVSFYAKDTKRFYRLNSKIKYLIIYELIKRFPGKDLSDIIEDISNKADKYKDNISNISNEEIESFIITNNHYIDDILYENLLINLLFDIKE